MIHLRRKAVLFLISKVKLKAWPSKVSLIIFRGLCLEIRQLLHMVTVADANTFDLSLEDVMLLRLIHVFNSLKIILVETYL